MDGADRRLSQYGTPYQPPSSGRPAPGPPMGPPAQEQYSSTAPSPSRSAMASQAAARPYMPEYPYTYDQQQQFQQQQLHYPSTYLSDPSRSQQIQPAPAQQQYAGYSHSSMLPPMQQSSVYERASHYQQQQQQQQQRQPAAIGVMANQFEGGSLPQYMQQGEQSSGVGIESSTSQYMTTQADQPHYGSMSYGRPQLQPPFGPPSSDYSMIEQHSISSQTQAEASRRQTMEEDKRQYENQIRTVFDAIVAGRVTEASDKLITATEWLLGSVRALGMEPLNVEVAQESLTYLGLHHDDEENHEQRILLWRELNHAWEALGMKQKTITEGALRTRQQPADFLSAATMHELIDKLVQSCDQIEKYGLVDYEMGLWEEQIVDIFIQCLNLLPREQT